jgi:hypothetical protein
MSIKTELAKLDKNALVELIADLYKKNKAVQEYLNFYFKPDEAGLIEKYRTKVYESFYPKRGFGYNLKQGKQYISEFKKLGSSSVLIADLMLFYVETGVQFTNDYGDMDETFYNSLESTFNNALKTMQKEGVLQNFKIRALGVTHNTQTIGWGFHDAVSFAYHQFYED